jgi:hypothetical protein
MRLILTTKKTEERDDAMQRQYREQEKEDKAEQSRRDDVQDERRIWSSVLQSQLDQGKRLVDATFDADEALKSYRERFQ